MQIKCLVENTSISTEFKPEHGLSLYIETEKHKLLFDLGASGCFIENAIKMNVDLTEVDTVIISHGHYDHGGGLKAFLNINSTAKVYVHKKAFEKHLSRRMGGEITSIGLDEHFAEHQQLIFVGAEYKIDDELFLFSNIKETAFMPLGNKDLLVAIEGGYENDAFLHEQNLLIRENGKNVLIAGCAHRGILNIVNQSRCYLKRMPDVAIGGFHLYSRSMDCSEPTDVVTMLGTYLNQTDVNFFTCHCTGTQAYDVLKSVMGGRIDYLATGNILNI